VGKSILSFQMVGPVSQAPIVVIFAGGDPPPSSVVGELPADAYVIAADSGFDHARRLGVDVDVVVGDFDSISPEGLALAGVVEQHPADKDATDLAIALDAALRQSPTRVIVVGGGGGRIDHFLANAALLTSSEYRAVRLTWLLGNAVVNVVRDRIELSGSPGDLVTILPYGGSAGGVTTTGLRWPLDHAVLASGTTRGVSNEMIEPTATIELTEGTLLVVQPEAV
jgi:thiamine pyrophosphokinase